MENNNEKCPVCGLEFKYLDSDYKYCSEYCDSALTDEEIDWRELKIGDYGLFPCSLCGCVIEGELDEERFCSPCYKKVRFENRTLLLKRCLALLSEETNTFEQLVSDIEKDVTRLISDIESELEKGCII